MYVVGLLLDIDDVLFDDTLWRRWFVQLLSHFDLRTTYRDFFQDWQVQYADDVNRGRREFWRTMQDFLFSQGLTTGQVDEVLAAGQSRRRQLLDAIRPLPGVLQTIAQLNSMHVPLGILCDAPWPRTQVRHMLCRLGLRDQFSPVVSSFDTGYTKPSAESYQIALEAMGLRPAQVAFVGHDTVELAGARAVGMRTIAFNHDHDAQADLFLERIDQLLSRVQFRSERFLLAG